MKPIALVLMLILAACPKPLRASPFLPHASTEAAVFRETRTLTPGEYQADFHLRLRGRPDDFQAGDLAQDAASVTIATADGAVAFVPTQHLKRGDFPLSGAAQSYSAYFYVARETVDVVFRVAREGTLEVEVVSFSVSETVEPPTRVLLLSGRGADTSGWQGFTASGSTNYGLTGGGQHFLAFVVQTLPCGSLADRTRLLADYINTLQVPDRSLKALGHSMGGLDLRLLVGLANEGREPYLTAARKLRKVYTAGTPHHGAAIARPARSILARPLRGILCIGEPLIDDVTPEAMAAMNARYPWERFEVDGRRMPFLAFTFRADCLPWWARWLGRDTDLVVPLESQTWGVPDNPPRDLPWSAVHASPLDIGSCQTERGFADMYNWILSDPVAAP